MYEWNHFCKTWNHSPLSLDNWGSRSRRSILAGWVLAWLSQLPRLGHTFVIGGNCRSVCLSVGWRRFLQLFHNLMTEGGGEGTKRQREKKKKKEVEEDERESEKRKKKEEESPDRTFGNNKPENPPINGFWGSRIKIKNVQSGNLFSRALFFSAMRILPFSTLENIPLFPLRIIDYSMKACKKLNLYQIFHKKVSVNEWQLKKQSCCWGKPWLWRRRRLGMFMMAIESALEHRWQPTETPVCVCVSSPIGEKERELSDAKYTPILDLSSLCLRIRRQRWMEPIGSI